MKLAEAHVAVIKGMHKRGDRQMDIAVWAGTNQARINEVIHCKRSGKKWKHVGPAPEDTLPEPGPYVVVSSRYLSVQEQEALVKQAVIRELQELIARYTHNTVTGL